MLADMNNAPKTSLSAAQLAEKLEKSEAGRKKLRQAISILQEKLDATEKVLKINDSLRQECEQERQRAEGEKKKVEEERKLRSMLEKDSTVFKDQLTKVLQRLGAVENRQKSDKKEVERMRNEVKLSVEGVRAAAQVVDAMRSSFQSLENTLLEKVNAAFEEAHVASQAVKCVQSSLQSLENNAMKKGMLLQGSLPDNKLTISTTKHVSEKLVADIARLFHKEKKSHRKIEHQLAALKTVLKTGRSDGLISSDEGLSPEKLASSNKEKDKESRKRKSREEEDAPDWKVNKREKLVRSRVHRKDINRQKQARKHHNISSPCRVECQAISEMPGSLSHRPSSNDTPSNEYIEEALVEYRGSSNGNAHVQIQPEDDYELMQKERQNRLAVQKEEVDRGIIVGGQCIDDTFMENGGSSKGISYAQIQPEDDHKVMQSKSQDKLADQKEDLERGLTVSRSTVDVNISDVDTDEIEQDLDFDLDLSDGDDLEDDWWSGDRVLLSPTLPEIRSPVHHSPPPCREPSPFREFSRSSDLLKNADTTITAMAPDINSGLTHRIPLSEESVLTEAATASAKEQEGAVLHCDLEKLEASIEQVDDAMQRIPPVVCGSALQLGSFARVESETSSKFEGEDVVDIAMSQLVPHDCASNATELGSEPAGHQQARSVKSDQHAGIHVSCKSRKYDVDTLRVSEIVSISSSHGASSTLDSIPTSKLGLNICSSADKQEFEDQFDDKYGFEAVNNTTLDEISNFLEDLPPIPSAFANGVCMPSPPQVPCDMQMLDCTITMPRDSICPTHEEPTKGSVCTHVIDISQSEIGQGSSIQHAKYSRANSDKEISPTMQKPSVLAKGPRLQVASNSSTQSSQVTCVVCLLQAFNFDEVEVKLNVTAACIIAMEFKGYLSLMDSDMEGKQLQEALVLTRVSPDVPIQYLACSFISSIVDLVKLENGREFWSSKAKPVDAVVQALVAFIRKAFKEKANSFFDTTFTQLGRFLNEGKVILMTFQELKDPNQDALSVARVINGKNHLSYQYSEATLEDIHAGSKVLAALCQVLSCVTHLQNVVYEVLGWCDKDTMWLLTVFSSFASVCGHIAFVVEADDLLGHAICAIITELVSSVEQGNLRRVKDINNEAMKSLADVSSNLPKGWAALKDSLELEGKLSLEEVLLAVLAALHHILSSTHDSLVPLSQSVLKDKIPSTEHCKVDSIHTSKWVGTALSDRKDKKEPVPYEESEVPEMSKTMQEDVSICQGNVDLKSLDWRRWQRQYIEAVGALELIALFMGWEWTYNHLIIRCLWRMVVPGSAQVCVAGISHILSILARTRVNNDGRDLPGVAELKKILAHILQSTSSLTSKASTKHFAFPSPVAVDGNFEPARFTNPCHL